MLDLIRPRCNTCGDDLPEKQAQAIRLYVRCGGKMANARCTRCYNAGLAAGLIKPLPRKIKFKKEQKHDPAETD